MSIFNPKSANDNARIKKCEQLVNALKAAATPVALSLSSFGELEELLLDASNECIRQILEEWLQKLNDSFGDEILITTPSENGSVAARVRYRRHQPGDVRYFSLCGPLEIEQRWTYRLAGVRNGPTAVPIELQAGLISKATPALAFALAQGHAKAPVRSVEEDLLAAHRRPPSRSTMDRIGRSVGLEVHGLVELLEPVVRAKEVVPGKAFAINLGLDRTTIPMEEPADEEDRKRPLVLKPRITVCYRMAYVGTVCITDRLGNTLCAWRYAAPKHEGPDGVLKRMIADINNALTQRPRLKLGVVQDGAPEMWNLVRDALRANRQTRRRKWRETVDRYHFMERVGVVLEAMWPKDERKRREFLNDARVELDLVDDAAKRILERLEHEARYVQRSKDLDWLVSNKLGLYMLCEDHFHYASLKIDGLHSGSGVTEGACKFLITTRAKRSGQRWSERGITAVLALRSLLASERLEPVWQLYAPRFLSECKTAA